jgi:hypothetical protein
MKTSLIRCSLAFLIASMAASACSSSGSSQRPAVPVAEAQPGPVAPASADPAEGLPACPAVERVRLVGAEPVARRSGELVGAEPVAQSPLGLVARRQAEQLALAPVEQVEQVGAEPAAPRSGELVAGLAWRRVAQEEPAMWSTLEQTQATLLVQVGPWWLDPAVPAQVARAEVDPAVPAQLARAEVDPAVLVLAVPVEQTLPATRANSTPVDNSVAARSAQAIFRFAIRQPTVASSA